MCYTGAPDSTLTSIFEAPVFCPECGAMVRDYGRGPAMVVIHCIHSCGWLRGYKIGSEGDDWEVWVNWREFCHSRIACP